MNWRDTRNVTQSTHGLPATADDATALNRMLVVPVTTSIRIGEIWGRYHIEERLGEGGFGSVYRAWDPDLRRRIAIKFLREHISDEIERAELLREGRALASVHHHNVVQVFGVEAHGNRVGLCMELVSGETLAGVLKSQGLLSYREAALIGVDLCRALSAIHEAGYLHRDVKVQNVMRDTRGRIVLMDFGTGHATATGMSGPSGIVGTLSYMAPEILTGGPASERSDIYSVGVLLYHLVTGEYPVKGRTVLDLIDAHRVAGRSGLERRHDLPSRFVRVVSRALAPDPANRWPSAQALLEPLYQAVHGRLTWARRIAALAVAVAGALIGLTALGMVSSRYFNLALSRGDFAREGVSDWLYWGALSVVAPAVLSLMVLTSIATLRVAGIVAARLFPRARTAMRGLGARWRQSGLADVDVTSALALACSVAVLSTVLWLLLTDVGTLLSLVNPNLSTTPAEVWQYLAPSNAARHESYRLGFSWACILVVAVWILPLRMAARQGRKPNAGILLGGGAVFLLSVLLLDFPYRLLYQSELEAVTWNGGRCFLLGERPQEILLLCPSSAPPRIKAVTKQDSSLIRLGTRVNPFDRALQ